KGISVSNPLIQSQSSLDFISHTLGTQALALGNLVHKVGLLLLQVNGEALLLGALHSLLNRITLGGTVGLLLFLDSLGKLAVVPLQGFAELGVGLALVVKVHGVGCTHIQDKKLVKVHRGSVRTEKSRIDDPQDGCKADGDRVWFL